MQLSLQQVSHFLDHFLALNEFPSDPSCNGLQVEACSSVSKIVYGVDASEALFRQAIEAKADLIVVHHGLFWGGGLSSITGLFAQRIRLLFENKISLYAVHLPLDAHPIIGHNAKLSEIIHLQNRESFFRYAKKEIGFSGVLPNTLTLSQLAEIYKNQLKITPRLFGNPDQLCSSVGIVSGGAGHEGVLDAVQHHFDVLITGEFPHEAYHYVQESHTAVIALGHYASETIGLKALQNHVFDKLAIEGQFIDIPTGL